VEENHGNKRNGYARAGSRRSPLWVGGLLSDQNRIVSKKVNKKKED
jgi:ribosomal protein L4